MSELNKMSVHALLEKVERLDVQLSDERMRARDLEIACHDERRLREIAEQKASTWANKIEALGEKLHSCELQLKQCNADRAELQRAVDQQVAEERTVAAKIELVREGAIALRNEHDAALARIARQDTELERVRSALKEISEQNPGVCHEIYAGCKECEDCAYLIGIAKDALASPAAEPVLSDTQDAARWRAMLAIPRIRPLGSAGLSRPEANNYAHFGLELWTRFSRDYSAELLEKLDRENELGREWLIKFADIAIAAQQAQPAPVAQSEEWTKHEVNVAFDPWTGEAEFLPIPDADQSEKEDAK